MHLIDEPTLLNFLHFCVLVSFCLIADVENHTYDEGGVSKDTSSHTEVAEIDVLELLIFKRYLAKKVMDDRVSIRVHHHAIAKLDIACVNIVTCRITHRQDCFTIETDCV